MKNTNKFLIFLFITGIIVSCENESEKSDSIENEPMVLSGKLIENTGCKNGLKSTYEINHVWDTTSCISYSYSSLNHQLILKHSSAAFNCCPDSIYTDISRKDDTIKIEYVEIDPDCRCKCLYDLIIEVEGVESQGYIIQFIEEDSYIGEMDRLVFSVDLAMDTIGHYCVTRWDYPWGKQCN